MKITEKIIGKSNLSTEEKKVARVYYGLPTAGKKTKNWVKNLSPGKRDIIMCRVERKIQQVLEAQRAG